MNAPATVGLGSPAHDTQPSPDRPADEGAQGQPQQALVELPAATRLDDQDEHTGDHAEEGEELMGPDRDRADVEQDRHHQRASPLVTFPPAARSACT
jgi:hypothetical protein